MNELVTASTEMRIRCVTMRVAAGLLCLLGLMLIASVVFSPLLATSPGTALALAATNSPGKTRSISATPTLSGSRSIRTAAGARVMAGQTDVDANTVALYHFDTDTLDASPNLRHGTLYGAAQISSGVYSGALSADGNGSYVRVPFGSSLPAMSAGTIEAFVDFAAACNSVPFSVVSLGSDYGAGNNVAVLKAEPFLVFELRVDGQVYRASSGINTCRYLTSYNQAPGWPYDVWRFHHVAGTWGPRGLEIWVDGVLHGIGNDDANASIPPYPFMCNPQAYLGIDPGFGPSPNGLYPYACMTPVMAPTMVATPHGDYAGGIPAFDYLLVGCDSTQSCFSGRVDEVRISNIQRNFSYTVDPTSTPTQTLTPVPLSAEYSVDAQTMALFHLNSGTGSIYDEARGAWFAKGDATVTDQGRFGSALDFRGVSTPAQMGFPGNPGNGTIEAWINVSSVSSALVLGAKEYYNSSSESMALRFDASTSGTLGFKIVGSSDTGTVDSGVAMSRFVGAWHHVAGTWGSRGLEIWIDGNRCATGSFTSNLITPVDGFYFGCGVTGNCLPGVIDEVRYSSTQRTFSPMVLASARSAYQYGSPKSGNSARADYWSFLPYVAVAPTPTVTPTPAQLCVGY